MEMSIYTLNIKITVTWQKIIITKRKNQNFNICKVAAMKI